MASVQVMYNAMLQKTGGDLYVGIMTVINTVREVISMPVQGITHSSQPVMGYNYGAKEYGRVKKAIVFVSAISVLYTLGMWFIVHTFPGFFIRIFNSNGDLVDAGIPAMRIYFFGFFMMAFQFAGQSIFVGLGKAKNAVFFSIFRKVIIVIPLIRRTLLRFNFMASFLSFKIALGPVRNFKIHIAEISWEKIVASAAP